MSLPHRSLRGLSGLFVAALALPLGPHAQAGPAELAPGVPVEHALGQAEAHVYRVRLAAGDFLRITLRQKGVDAALELKGPDGARVALVDGPNPDAEYATEDLAVVAPASGLYEILVLGNARMAPPYGYRLEMEAPHPAGEADARREEAMRADQEATETIGRGPLERQLALREKALATWQALGERRAEAATLLQLGMVLCSMKRPEAVERLAEAARIWGELGDRGWQARALYEAGHAASELSRLEEARAPLERAVELATDPEDEATRARSLNNLGYLLTRLGEPREALPALEEALAIAERRRDAASQVSILVNLGYALMDLSETQDALLRFQQALAVPGADRNGRAPALHALGVLYESLGTWDKAIDFYEQALALADAQGDKRRAAATLNNLGVVYRSSDQIDKALVANTRALALARATTDVPLQVQILTNLGSVYLKMKRKEDAIAAWREVEPLAGDRRELEVAAFAARAGLEKELNDLDAAESTLNSALERAQAREHQRWQAEVTLSLARLERERGHLPQALTRITSAVAIIEALRTQVTSLDLRALFLADKQTYYEFYIDTLMALHREHPGAGWDAQALQVSERARARSLLELLTTGGGARKAADRSLLERERRLRADLSAREIQRLSLVQAGASPERIREADARLAEAITRYRDIEAELRQSSPGYAALTQPRPLSAAEIQTQVLGDRALLLEVALGETRSYLWAVTPSSIDSFELPPRARIEKAARRYYDALTAGNVAVPDESTAARRERIERAGVEAALAGRDLSGMLLTPVEKLLGDRTLLVVADGMLQYVPFSALPLPSAAGQTVLAKNEVVNLPSASALAVLRGETLGRAPAPKTIAVLADPVFERDDIRFAQKPGKPRKPAVATSKGTLGRAPRRTAPPRRRDAQAFHRLHFSADEAAAIARLVPADQRLEATGFEASVAKATSGELAGYRIVHFATHGVLDTSQPELSKLVLSQWNRKGERQDGFLRLSEVYSLDLNADLVALSACQTALGQEIRGEGLVGLTRGFMYAGARRVLASLWSVDDRATALLMRRFYRHLLNDPLPAAAALRRAQLEMAADPQWQSPYYWAGFSLQGEWQ
jgi:CHAT domain-containing protein/Tfp pilus assembly protein PilF